MAVFPTSNFLQNFPSRNQKREKKKKKKHPIPMKKTGLFAASVAAASATALSAPPSSAGVLKTTISHQDKVNRDEEISPSRRSPASTAAEQFAPRFDGLRFIETLVTAHR